MNGGEINRNALIESFSKIRDDITSLKEELSILKEDNLKLKEENSSLKRTIDSLKITDNNNNNGSSELNSKELISQIIHETISKLHSSNPKQSTTKKINKNRKQLIKNRIITLANKNKLSISELKHIVVEQEDLCSKATFYRYVEKLKKLELIGLMKIDDIEILVTNSMSN